MCITAMKIKYWHGTLMGTFLGKLRNAVIVLVTFVNFLLMLKVVFGEKQEVLLVFAFFWSALQEPSSC